MAENFDNNGANFVSPGSFNPHHENGNIGGGPTFGPQIDKMVRFDAKEPDVDPNLAAEIANRSYFRTGESLSTEQVAGAEDPQELFEGLRAVLSNLENGEIPHSLEDRYGATRLFGMMLERQKLLARTPDELVKKGWIKNYDKKTGVGTPKKRKYASLALSIEETPVSVRGGGTVIDVEYNFGTPEKRAELAKAYERAIGEFECRSIMGEQVGVRLNAELRDGLENLVNVLRSGRTPKFKPEHLAAIFNMPGVDELEKRPENKQLGDQVEEAMFLNLIMLRSGTKKSMQDLLARPGSKYLIGKMAKEKESRTGKTCTYDDWVRENIGDLSNWVEDKIRDLKDIKNEVLGGYRGSLTKWGNIPAVYQEGYNGEVEKKFIGEVMGGLVGSAEAAWIAATMMRVTGTYASEGYVALPNGQFALQLGEKGYIAGDDTGKFRANIQTLKEGMKERSSFLKGMIGNIPDMAMNLFDWAQVDVTLPSGETDQRSIWDAWLGREERNKIYLETQELSNDKIDTEDYHRLGDLNFSSLMSDFHTEFATMQWLMGNAEGPTGVLNEANKTNFKADEFELDSLKKKWKYVGILFNKFIMTQGSPYLYVIRDDKKDKDGKLLEYGSLTAIKKNFFRNLMYARVHSACFTKTILPTKTKLFNDQGKDHEVYTAVLIKANIDEALNFAVPDESSLLEHYIDENNEMIALGERFMGTATTGTTADVVKFLKDDFVPENLKGRPYLKHTGIVSGRNHWN